MCQIFVSYGEWHETQSLSGLFALSNNVAGNGCVKLRLYISNSGIRFGSVSETMLPEDERVLQSLEIEFDGDKISGFLFDVSYLAGDPEVLAEELSSIILSEKDTLDPMIAADGVLTTELLAKVVHSLCCHLPQDETIEAMFQQSEAGGTYAKLPFTLPWMDEVEEVSQALEQIQISALES